jgi:hypothetical protein
MGRGRVRRGEDAGARDAPEAEVAAASGEASGSLGSGGRVTAREEKEREEEAEP